MSSDKKLLRKHLLQVSRAVCKQNPDWRAQQSIKLCENLLPICSNFKNIGLYLPLYFEIDVEPLLLRLLDQSKSVFVPELFQEEAEEQTKSSSSDQQKPVLSMRFVQVLSKEDLSKNFLPVPPYNIREPPKRNDGEDDGRIRFEVAESSGKLDMMIAPGVAFDEKCNRLGKGGGFYDRWISKSRSSSSSSAGGGGKSLFCVGVAFDEQLPVVVSGNEKKSWWRYETNGSESVAADSSTDFGEIKVIPVDPWDCALDMILSPSFSFRREGTI